MTAKRLIAASDEALKTSDQRKRAQIPVRTSAELRHRLAGRAAAKDRSLTQEIEQRLEWSLDYEDRLGGAAAFDLFLGAVARIAKAEEATGKHWLDDYVTWRAAKHIIERAVIDHAPPPPNSSAILAALKASNAARERELTLWREHLDRFPTFLPPGTWNALMPTYEFHPDGTKKSPEEIADWHESMRRVMDARQKLANRDADLKTAEQEEAEADHAGLSVAQEIISAMDRRRSVG